MSDQKNAPRPFVVDDEVMDRIRPMEHRDAGRVAELHGAAMGDSLWARLGHRFLTELYRGLVDNPRFLGFVYEERDDSGERVVRGFIGGSTSTSEMMKELFKSRWLVLGVAATPKLVTSPSVIPLLAETGLYSLRSGDDEVEVPGESLFCSFEPGLRGKRISGHINKVLFDDLASRGHKLVKVTTEVDNVGANRQLASWGFERRGEFRFYGKEMVRYLLDLTTSDRVEPISRHPSI